MTICFGCRPPLAWSYLPARGHRRPPRRSQLSKRPTSPLPPAAGLKIASRFMLCCKRCGYAAVVGASLAPRLASLQTWQLTRGAAPAIISSRPPPAPRTRPPRPPESTRESWPLTGRPRRGPRRPALVIPGMKHLTGRPAARPGSGFLGRRAGCCCCRPGPPLSRLAARWLVGP